MTLIQKVIRADDSLVAGELLLKSSKKRKLTDNTTTVAVSQMLSNVDIDYEFDEVKKLPKLKLNSLTISNDSKTLLPCEWISSFIIDDVINNLVISYEKEKSILYIPSGIYAYFYTMHDSINILQTFINSDTLNKDFILITINTQPLKGEHWILGIIHLKLKMIIILDSIISLNQKKEHFICLIQITYLYHNVLNYFNKTSFKFNLDDWQCVYASDSIQQGNMYDCGLYVCLHAFFYISDSYFFNTPSNDGREWLFYNFKEYSELINTKLVQDHTYFNKNDIRALNSEDIQNLTKIATKKLEELHFTIHNIPVQPLSIKIK